MSTVALREVRDDDLPIFFENQRDPDAIRMAAFTAEDPEDRDAFFALWKRILEDDEVIKRTILCEGEVAGSITRFMQLGHPSVSYWIGRAFWGRGVATRALAAFLQVVTERPLYARAVTDNAGSIRVLGKSGFVACGEESAFAHGRGEVVTETLFVLE